MKHFLKAFLFGLAVWVIPFVTAMVIFPIRETQRPLFESIMPVAVALGTVIFAVLYLKNIEMNFLSEGFWLGILWLAISVIIDMLMFSWGPMQMNFIDYLMDIGITYLMMPVITVGMGALEQARFNKLMKWVPPAK